MLLALVGALLVGAVVYVAVSAITDSNRPGNRRHFPGGWLGSAGVVQHDSAARSNCQVTTRATARPPANSSTGPGWIASGGLWVNFGEEATIIASRRGLAPPGTIHATPGPQGSIRAKIPWVRSRRAFGRLKVEGRRRPGGDRLTRADYDNHLGPTSKVVPGAMVFPRGGCWQIDATSGHAALRAVIWVQSSET